MVANAISARRNRASQEQTTREDRRHESATRPTQSRPRQRDLGRTRRTKTRTKGGELKMITEKGKAWIKENGWDGHTIWTADGVPFADLGLDEADKKRLTQRHVSDTSSPKSTIFKDGQIVGMCDGVHNLSLMRAIAGKLGVGDAGAMFMGRGSEARALTNAILNIIDPIR